MQIEPEPLLMPSERVHIKEALDAGIESICQMTVGERRVMVLIDLLYKQLRVRLAPAYRLEAGCDFYQYHYLVAQY